MPAYGGKYIVRGGAVEPKEGGWARKWYDSPEYKPLLAMRLKAANSQLIFVEGV